MHIYSVFVYLNACELMQLALMVNVSQIKKIALILTLREDCDVSPTLFHHMALSKLCEPCGFSQGIVHSIKLHYCDTHCQ